MYGAVLLLHPPSSTPGEPSAQCVNVVRRANDLGTLPNLSVGGVFSRVSFSDAAVGWFSIYLPHYGKQKRVEFEFVNVGTRRLDVDSSSS